LKIAQLCAARGHDVTIFTRTWQGERPENVRIELFGRHGWSNISRNRAWLKQLVRTLSERELDGVIGFNKLPGLDIYYGSDLVTPRRFNGSNHFGIAGCRAIATSVRWRNRCSRAANLRIVSRADRAGNSALRKILRHGTRTFSCAAARIERRAFTPEQKHETRARLRRERNWSPEEQLPVGRRLRLPREGTRPAPFVPSPSWMMRRAPTHDWWSSVKIDPTEFAMLARKLGVSERVHFLGGRHDVFDWLPRVRFARPSRRAAKPQE